MVVPQEISTLQVLLSGRIIITGILNEILLVMIIFFYSFEDVFTYTILIIITFRYQTDFTGCK